MPVSFRKLRTEKIKKGVNQVAVPEDFPWGTVSPMRMVEKLLGFESRFERCCFWVIYSFNVCLKSCAWIPMIFVDVKVYCKPFLACWCLTHNMFTLSWLARASCAAKWATWALRQSRQQENKTFLCIWHQCAFVYRLNSFSSPPEDIRQTLILINSCILQRKGIPLCKILNHQFGWITWKFQRWMKWILKTC